MNRALNFRRLIGQRESRAMDGCHLSPAVIFFLLYRLVIFKPVAIFLPLVQRPIYLHFKERLDFGSRLCVVSSLLRLVEDYG
jgi:hypothetical protein